MGYLPNNLNLDKMLLRHNPYEIITINKNRPNIVRDNFVYILSLLFYRMNENRNNTSSDDSSTYYNLCSTILQPMISNYRQYLDWLETTEIIESDQEWSKGKKCIGYRYCFKYRKAVLHKPKQEVLYNKKLCDKLSKIKSNNTDEVINKYPDLIKWYDLLDVDMEEADKIIESPLIDDANEQYHETRLHNIKYVKDSFSYSIGTTGRLHNPICNLKKELRSSLRVNGSRLVETDIKSSIPFISTMLFNREFLQDNSDILNDIGLTIKNNYDNKTPNHIMLGKKGIVVSIDPNKEDIKRYIEDVRSGDIYEILRDDWNTKLDTNYDRSTAKKKFLAIMNSPSYLKSREEDVAALKYPNVLKFIVELNGSFVLKGKKKTNNNDVATFSHLTQRIESRFVLDKCCKRLSEECPDVPIFTIHDSIWTSEQNKGLVMQIMIEESMKLFGLEVHLK